MERSVRCILKKNERFLNFCNYSEKSKLELEWIDGQGADEGES